VNNSVELHLSSYMEVGRYFQQSVVWADRLEVVGLLVVAIAIGNVEVVMSMVMVIYLLLR